MLWSLFSLLVLCWCGRSSFQSSVVVLPTTVSPSNEAIPREKSDSKPNVYSLHVLSTVQYRFAHTLVSSRVANVANESKEIFFSVLLPETAFISGFLMEIDDNVYKAHVKEKEEAKKEYDDAVRGGRTAGHVAQSARNSNRFTVSVNIEPQKKVTFNLTYEELLKRELSLYNLAININPGQIVRDMLVEVKINETSPIKKLSVPALKESNEILDDSPKENELATIERPSDSSAIIRWNPTQEQQTELNKDGVKGQLVVQYDVDRSVHPEQILVDEGYFVHFFAPENLPTLRKHVTFVLDVSGSMEGRKLEQLKQAMETILSDLKPSDYFSLIIFSRNVQVWDIENPNAIQHFDDYYYNGGDTTTTERPQNYRSLVLPANAENVNRSKEFILQLQSYSTTNIYGGLEKAIEISEIGQNITKATNENEKAEPMIIFLTDGEANVGESDTSQIVKKITNLNKELRATIFCLSLGNDADLDFLKKLSLHNSGFARKIYEASDAAIQLRNFYKEVASPLLVNVTFNYPENQVEVDNVTKTNFNTFFSGSEIVIAGKLKSDNLTGTLTARTANGNTTIDFEPILICPFPSWTIQSSPEPSTENATFMERLWGYLTIQQLLDKKAESSDDDNNNSTAYNKGKALQLALKYSFVTPLTSLVIIKPNETSSANTEKGDVDSPLANRGYASSLLGVSGYRAFQHIPIPRTGNRNYFPLSDIQHYAAPASLGNHNFLSFAPSYDGNADIALAEVDVDYTAQEYPQHTAQMPTLTILQLSNISWIPQSANETDIFIANSFNGTNTLLLGLNQTNEAYESCATPAGEAGHCRHLKFCVLTVFVNAFNEYAPYQCIINQIYAGVCCPDSLVDTETTTYAATTIIANSAS